MYELVIDNIKTKTQIDLGVFDRSFLKNYLLKRFKTFSISTELEYVNIINKNPKEIHALLESMRITYTDFYRDSLIFSYLERVILPSITTERKKTRNIRIWCSACSTGQEAYSVAFTLEKYIKTLNSTLTYQIFATDNNDDVLEIAKAGSYSISELKNISLHDFEENFEKVGEKYIVSDNIKSKISFSNHDLLDEFNSTPSDGIYGDYNIVLCCNLLFYYDKKTRFHIMKKLGNALTHDGYLITGSAEKTYKHLNEKLTQASFLLPVYYKNSKDLEEKL